MGESEREKRERQIREEILELIPPAEREQVRRKLELLDQLNPAREVRSWDDPRARAPKNTEH